MTDEESIQKNIGDIPEEVCEKHEISNISFF